MSNDKIRQYLLLKTRNDFATFIVRVFQTIVSGQVYQDNWHIRAMAWELDRCAKGDRKRLIITVPPRYLKSLCASVALPAWILAHDPTRRVICISYSLDLASKFALDCRAVMESTWYQEAFPKTRLSRERSREMDFMTTARGGRFSTSVGGTLTGRGGNFIILDDLLKPTDAMSETVRANVTEWIDRTLYTRLDDKVEDVIVAVMQRLHVDDPVGHLRRKNEEWHHLNLPAVSDLEQRIPIGPDQVYVRPAGELLHASREPQRVLERLRNELGGLSYAAQYLQCPVPPEGEILKWRWLREYEELPQRGRDDRIVQSWDTACTAEQHSDYSVCTTWLVCEERYFLMHVLRERLNYPDLKRTVIEHAHAFGVDTVIIEDRSFGTALLQDFDDEWSSGMPDVVPYEPQGDKVTRMSRYSARIEAGRVFVPTSAPWLDELRSELLQFPRGRYDDQVDSISQFLAWAENERHEYVGFVGWLNDDGTIEWTV